MQDSDYFSSDLFRIQHIYCPKTVGKAIVSEVFKVWIAHTGLESKHRIAALGLGCLLLLSLGGAWNNEVKRCAGAPEWVGSRALNPKPEARACCSVITRQEFWCHSSGQTHSALLSCCVWCRCLSCSPVLILSIRETPFTLLCVES